MKYLLYIMLAFTFLGVSGCTDSSGEKFPLPSRDDVIRYQRNLPSNCQTTMCDRCGAQSEDHKRLENGDHCPLCGHLNGSTLPSGEQGRDENFSRYTYHEKGWSKRVEDERIKKAYVDDYQCSDNGYPWHHVICVIWSDGIMKFDTRPEADVYLSHFVNEKPTKEMLPEKEGEMPDSKWYQKVESPATGTGGGGFISVSQIPALTQPTIIGTSSLYNIIVEKPSIYIELDGKIYHCFEELDGQKIRHVEDAEIHREFKP